MASFPICFGYEQTVPNATDEAPPPSFRTMLDAPKMAAVRLPLSVVIVARNEELNLPRCLASVQDWVAEMVVVLNDTTDRSADVAREFGAKVAEQTWRGYRDTKNAALDLAANNWVLALDADEAVSPALREDIRKFFADAHDRFVGARFPRKVWFVDRWITHGDWYPDLSLRLFRRDRARWGGDAFVHEKIECEGAVTKLSGDLYHYSFPTLASHVAKINPFAELFVRQQASRGTKFSWFASGFRPVWRFVRGYFIKRGFLDGFPGLYIAVATSFATFVRYSRLYEAEHAPTPAPPAGKENVRGANLLLPEISSDKVPRKRT